MKEFTTLEALAEKVSGCTDCPLSQSRTTAVPGEGAPNVKVVFIGEAPGFHEDRQGRPFVGPAGGFLEELLASVGLKREDVFITNMVKCRPPSNRDPLPGEIAECSKYLDRQLQLIKPRVIVTLGRYSLAKFFPRESISKSRGKAHQWQGITIHPMYHPAAALHQQSLRRVIEEDIKALPGLLQQAESQEQRELTPSPQQLSMF